ncbi:MAG: DUF2345 domain-containing protein, partial [Lysobacter sp.]
RDGGDPVEKFATPLLFVESPDAIALTTPNSALAYAGGNVHLTSQQDAHLTAGHTFAGVSGGHVALFAQHSPIKAIAGNGPLSLQAHAGPLELLADQSVTVIATDERIDVLAKSKIVLQAGNTQITLEGGDITFACPGTFTVKAGEVPFKGGASEAATLVALPDGTAATMEPKHWIALDYRDAELDMPMAGAEYEIHFKGGPKLTGTLDNQGKARHDDVPNKDADKVVYKPRPPESEEPYSALEDLLTATASQRTA